MKTKSSKKERNEKVRQMVQEIAYRSMTGQKVSRNELAIKYKVSAGILTIAQHKGYIEKQGIGKYIIKVEFTDLIIDELYAAHAENTKKSTEKKKPIDPHSKPILEFTKEYPPLFRKTPVQTGDCNHLVETAVTGIEEVVNLLDNLCEISKKAQSAKDLLRRILINGEYTKRGEL